MKHHTTDSQARRAAVEFLIDAREASTGGGREPPVVDRAISDSEERLRSFYEQIDSAEHLLAHAASIEIESPPDGRAAPRAIPMRRVAAQAGVLIAAAVTFAVVHIGPPAGRVGPVVVPETPVEPALLARAEPPEIPRELPAEEEPPALVSDPIVLQVDGLESILFAIGWRRGPSIGGDVFELDADDFCSKILTRLDPVDQWRVHQAALASRGYYPVDQIDGLYGEKTAEGLERFFEGRPVGRLIRRGLLSEEAAKVLLGEIDSIALSLPSKSPAGVHAPQNHVAARTAESETESDHGETTPRGQTGTRGQTSPRAGALNR